MLQLAQPSARRLRRDAALFAATFAALVGAGLILLHWQALSRLANQLLLVALVAFVAASAASWRGRRAVWHILSNIFTLEAPRILARPWVIDGDTIDDLATGVRYRLANIDAPETGDSAKCFNERVLGDAAKCAAIRRMRAATQVAVRRTWRTDRFGRRVAFVLVDGQDLGDILVARGLARPWIGWRRNWCGPRGGLAAAAKAGSYSFACRACRRWR